MPKSFTLAIVAAAAVSVAGCGGGSDSDGCQQSGAVAFEYSPGATTASGPRLDYKLGQGNTWTLKVSGVNAACLSGMNVTLTAGTTALPPGMTLDATTGEIKSGVMTQHVEGYCGTTNTYSSTDRSTNRQCATGQTFHEARFAVLVKTDAVNTNKIPTVLTFAPTN